MLNREEIRSALGSTIGEINLSGYGEKISGKSRDCYVQGDKRIIVASDRLSAFDVILSTIPFKGQLLTKTAMHWFSKTEDIIQNHVIDNPHPNVLVVNEVEIIPVEVIVRGYLTGSGWRDYSAGKDISGIRLAEGLKKSQQLPEPILTPSTKAAIGEHDEPISSEEIVSSGLVEKKLWDEICQVAFSLYQRGVELAAEQDLILVDTKYELGLLKTAAGLKLVLADEIHTQDSSRFWVKSSYQEKFAAAEDPDMLDKEFVRRELMKLGFMGEGTPPELSDDFRIDTALRYIEAYEKITGDKFSPGEVVDIESSLPTL